MNISKSSVLIGALCVLSASASGAAPEEALPPAAIPPGWKLAWADEFDKPGLPDPSMWDYDTELNKRGWHNEELQYYARARPENSRVADGKLLITARRETLSDAPDFGGQPYTSARLFTRGRYEFTYGYVEVRARLPCGLGTWPAIWMLGSEGKWPERGEIDIMEHVGKKKGEVLASFHTGAFNWPAKTQKTAVTRVESACDAFPPTS
ncbi:MAG TPA: glycoside hydrolase family 16 protein [Telluria sp.]|nr:glycoside hydrolase family 16 protein [Telluria sp.]